MRVLLQRVTRGHCHIGQPKLVGLAGATCCWWGFTTPTPQRWWTGWPRRWWACGFFLDDDAKLNRDLVATVGSVLGFLSSPCMATHQGTPPLLHHCGQVPRTSYSLYETLIAACARARCTRSTGVWCLRCRCGSSTMDR